MKLRYKRLDGTQKATKRENWPNGGVKKSIAERRLGNPLSTTNEEKSYFRRHHSFKF